MTEAALPAGVGAESARWLFSEHFLADRVRAWPEFVDVEVGQLYDELRALWVRERLILPGANEGQTEERFIRPVLRLLRHAFTLFAPIPNADKTPDYFFYGSDATRETAERAPMTILLPTSSSSRVCRSGSPTGAILQRSSFSEAGSTHCRNKSETSAVGSFAGSHRRSEPARRRCRESRQWSVTTSMTWTRSSLDWHAIAADSGLIRASGASAN